MPNVCILTDSTAQFTQSDYTGHERVHIIPFELRESTRRQGGSLPNGVSIQKQLIPPSAQNFMHYYDKLISNYDSVLVLTLSSQLSPVLENAITGAGQSKNGASVLVIDSQTTCIGLGMLAQLAAGEAANGSSLKEIEQTLRANIPQIYMIFCLPELTYLAHAGYMDYAQALVAEMMGLLPIFTFEEGRLVPTEKVRTPRHLFEAFQEFMDEFEAPAQIALVRSSAKGSLSTSQLRQFVEETFPLTSFSEHTLQPHLEALFGLHSIGLVLMDSM